MTSSSSLNLPPRGAAWLISLFASEEETQSILGDLSEEFSRLVLQSGSSFARRWYWRQALKSLPHIVFSAFHLAPWSTGLAVLAGFLLRRLLARLPDFATFALVDRFAIHEHHFGLYRFLASTALDIEHVLIFFLVGCFVAVLARKREMAPAILLALFYVALSLVGSTVGAIRTGEYASLFRLSWYFTDALSIVFGALFIRTLRPHTTSQPLHG